MLLQNDIDDLQQWEKKWKMEFNPDKHETISISNKRKPITATYIIHRNRSNMSIVPNTLASLLTISYHATQKLKLSRETPVYALVTSNPAATRHKFPPLWSMPPLCGIQTPKSHALK